METTERVIDRLRLVGGDLSLDFVNTRSGPADGPPELEGLTAYEDVVAWATRVGVLSQAQAAKLRRIAASDTGAAARAVGEALSVRETLSSVLVPLARGTEADRRAVNEVGRLASAAAAAGELTRVSGAAAFDWTWSQGTELRAPLWPVAFAAGELLRSPTLERLKGCAGCSFVYLDESKNGSRRWCSMDDCGRAAKIRSITERRAAKRKQPPVR